MIKPIIYVDTVIARDWTHNRNKDSQRVLDSIKSRKYKTYMSVFGLMELVNIEQEDLYLHKKAFIDKEDLDRIFTNRKSRDLNQDSLQKSEKYIRDFLDSHKLTLVDLTNEGWSLAFQIAVNSNLNASDVLHLATAWQSKCNLVITRDEFFIKEATKILKKEKVWSFFRICRPSNFEKCVKSIKSQKNDKKIQTN